MYIKTPLEFVESEIAQLTWHISPRQPCSRVLALDYLSNSAWHSFVWMKPTIKIECVRQKYYAMNAFMFNTYFATNRIYLKLTCPLQVQ